MIFIRWMYILQKFPTNRAMFLPQKEIVYMIFVPLEEISSHIKKGEH